jgi:S-(hydroxymethyl)glutathione dehydrogenase/alcohol dehydrogenase
MAITFAFLGRSPTRIKPQKTLDFILTSHFPAISFGAKIESVAAKSASQTTIFTARHRSQSLFFAAFLFTYSTHNFSSTQGQPIQCKAMVSRQPRESLSEEMITVNPPKAGEVRVKVIANALCHTDIYTLDGQDPEVLFPCILGHEAGCIVESVRPGVTSVKPGDHGIPCYTPMCCESTCIFCQSPKTNLCPAIRSTQGKGVMPDGTVRFHDKDGNGIYHFMGCSTMSEYTVLAEISCAKISKEMALEKACLFGCGISTGLGALSNS